MVVVVVLVLVVAVLSVPEVSVLVVLSILSVVLLLSKQPCSDKTTRLVNSNFFMGLILLYSFKGSNMQPLVK